MSIFKRLLLLTSILAVSLTLLMLLARLHWFPEILTHFRLPCAIGFFVLIVILVCTKSFKSALAVSLCFSLQAFPLAHHYLPFLKDQRQTSGPPLKIISFNILTSNPNKKEVLNFLQTEDPDLICLQEVSTEWLQGLHPLISQYPHSVSHPRNDNFGLLLLSKHPLTSHQIDNSPHLYTPYLIAQIEWQGTELTIINAHPVPPMSHQRAQNRNATIKRIHHDATHAKTPFIVMGDFNCSAYSPHFAPLKKSLRDSSRGRGYPVTWQRGNPLFGIPIDHLLHSEHFVCTEREIGPKLGSDHSPIIATLQAAETSTGSADL